MHALEHSPQSHIPTAMWILSACPLRVIGFGAGNRLGHLLGDGTKKRHPYPSTILLYLLRIMKAFYETR